MDDPSQNPYAAPSELADLPTLEEREGNRARPTFGNALFRWSLVCIVSAGPSFFLGCLTIGNHWVGVPAMIFGVALYAVAYASLDIRPIWRQWMSNKVTRNCIIAAYGVRVLVSIAFPVGIANDMWAGMFSLT